MNEKLFILFYFFNINIKLYFYKINYDHNNIFLLFTNFYLYYVFSNLSRFMKNELFFAK